MKMLTAVICLTFALSPLALADDQKTDTGKTATDSAPKKEPSAKQKAQRQKMKDCSKNAKDKGLKGDERKQFMSNCMKG